MDKFPNEHPTTEQGKACAETKRISVTVEEYAQFILSQFKLATITRILQDKYSLSYDEIQLIRELIGGDA